MDQGGASLRGPSVVRWVARSPTAPSGREWNGSQSGQGATELSPGKERRDFGATGRTKRMLAQR